MWVGGSGLLQEHHSERTGDLVQRVREGRRLVSLDGAQRGHSKAAALSEVGLTQPSDQPIRADQLSNTATCQHVRVPIL